MSQEHVSFNSPDGQPESPPSRNAPKNDNLHLYRVGQIGNSTLTTAVSPDAAPAIDGFIDAGPQQQRNDAEQGLARRYAQLRPRIADGSFARLELNEQIRQLAPFFAPGANRNIQTLLLPYVEALIIRHSLNLSTSAAALFNQQMRDAGGTCLQLIPNPDVRPRGPLWYLRLAEPDPRSSRPPISVPIP
jgi:hypothetical protein